MVSLSPQQTNAVDRIMAWNKGTDDQRFVLAGYAGAGKTTMAKYIASELGEDNVAFLAYTGKAANVLREKGCRNAQTIHSSIYKLVDENAAEPEFTLNEDSDIRYKKLIILDEYSMISKELIKDIESFGVKILYLGDPFQLPPVDGECDLKADLFIDEVHRQALGSNIIRYATMVRNGEKIPFCDHKDFVYQPKKDVAQEEYINADQIICGYNNTRNAWNDRFRIINGYSGMYPQKGEKLICLKNNRKSGLFNGMIGECTSAALKKSERENSQILTLSFDDYHDLEIWDGDFQRHGKPMDKRYRYLDRFDFASVITAHKSQGSEFNNVLVYNEPIGRGIDRLRWTYTALTRARKRCVLVQP